MEVSSSLSCIIHIIYFFQGAETAYSYTQTAGKKQARISLQPITQQYTIHPLPRVIFVLKSRSRPFLFSLHGNKMRIFVPLFYHNAVNQ
jgi:hypothetical protein